MINVIAFDADDTLWHNETHYLNASQQFQRLLSRYTGPEEVQQALDEMENNNIQYYGYGIKSFILSMIETALAITDGRIEGREIEQIIAIAKQMLDAEVELFEHTEGTLAELSASYDLMLITKGDLFEQERKVKRTAVVKYFRYIEIIGDKTAETYRILCAKYGLDPHCFLMVGNSLRSDILPVLEIGGKAVYIPYANTWVHEAVELPEGNKPGFFELEHLGQLSALLQQVDCN